MFCCLLGISLRNFKCRFVSRRYFHRNFFHCFRLDGKGNRFDLSRTSDESLKTMINQTKWSLILAGRNEKKVPDMRIGLMDDDFPGVLPRNWIISKFTLFLQLLYIRTENGVFQKVSFSHTDFFIPSTFFLISCQSHRIVVYCALFFLIFFFLIFMFTTLD